MLLVNGIFSLEYRNVQIRGTERLAVCCVQFLIMASLFNPNCIGGSLLWSHAAVVISFCLPSRE